MFGIIGFIKRWFAVFRPSEKPKANDALRFGILGAANIAPLALILPAKSHPDVIVAAVAARDIKRAEAYAKKHGIPIVHKTYDDLISDPSIDCVYVPLPNGLHYDWTLKALAAGKHVLLEKPATSNAEEAKLLFRHPILSKPNAPVLLEAFHYRFHPAWQYFVTMFNPGEVSRVEATNKFPSRVFSKDDIRFNYSLAGGTLMDFGTYTVSAMRSVFRSEPTKIASASHRGLSKDHDERIEAAILAEYEFPNGGTGRIYADLQTPWSLQTVKAIAPRLKVKLADKDGGVENGLQKIVKTELRFCNYMLPTLYHHIDIEITTTFAVPSNPSKIVKSETTVGRKKFYKWAQDSDKVGEEWWTTYRYQLEEFVNRVKGREGSGVWVTGEESIEQMKVIDQTYLKANLPLRPTSASVQQES